jgi:hypothetical protein
MDKKLMLRWILIIVGFTTTLNVFLFSTMGLILSLIGYFSLEKTLDKKELALFQQHNIVQALKKRNIRFILTDFLNSMFFEELVFRFYIIAIIFIDLLGPIPTILVNGLIFSMYHLHMYKKFPSKRLIIVFLIYTFFLGVYLGFLFLESGVIFTIVAHSAIVLLIYYLLSRK